ncbi:MAG: metallophosphoesterase [Cytophagales bacterium]|nr:metallophosphoesterase [Cytophagales bacterium]
MMGDNILSLGITIIELLKMTSAALIFRFVIVIIILLLIDLYTFQGLKTIVSGYRAPLKWAVYLSHWSISLVWIAFFIYGISYFDRTMGPRGTIYMVLSASFVLFWFPKLIFCIFLLTEDVVRHLVGLAGIISQKINPTTTYTDFIPERRKVVSMIAFGIASIPFAGILYGIIKGKYDYKVHKHTLYFKDLPEVFDGLTITQLSDLHSGSFDDTEAVQRGVQMVNELKSDIFVFTGDIVNNRAEEYLPWVEIFKKIEAPLGKYSILGNHDYGEYVMWPSANHYADNMKMLYELHALTGFDLLNNANRIIEKDSQKLAIVGVENWGLPPFPQKGDLKIATQNIDNETFKILLSHDPSHWDEQVLKHEQKIQLTLSGHTHGMQFGIEIPGIVKWSPVKYKYPRWAGIYQVGEQILNVNRGFGFIGFPGRVGIWPEITHIILRRKS